MIQKLSDWLWNNWRYISIVILLPFFGYSIWYVFYFVKDINPNAKDLTAEQVLQHYRFWVVMGSFEIITIFLDIALLIILLLISWLFGKVMDNKIYKTYKSKFQAQKKYTNDDDDKKKPNILYSKILH